jgi:hypothetical protein
VAAKVAKLHQADALAAHYAGFGLADPTTDRLVPALAFARLLTFTPVEATPPRCTLNPRGLEPAGHRHPGAAGGLCQLPEPTAAGLRALNHQPIVSADTPVVAGYWHTTPQTQSGKAAPVRFTRDELHGNPGWRINRWRNLALKNRRSWRNMAIAIRLLPPAGAQPAGAGAADADR